MENTQSKKWSLNIADIQKILIGLLVAVGGTVLITAADWLKTGSFDWNLLLTLEAGAIGSTIVNTFRKLLAGE